MAIKFIDTTQYVDYGPNGDILQPLTNYTLMCWFNTTDLSSYKMIIGREDITSGNPGYHLEINASGVPGFHSDHGVNMVFGTTTLTLNTWYHFVGVRDGTAGTQKIYINGVLENSNACGTIETVVTSFRFGSPEGWPTEGFIGTVDDARFYNRVLRDDEIATIYACRGCDSIYYGLQGHWTFSEGAKDQPMGNSSGSNTSNSSLTMAYVVPTGNNLVLVVSATAESTTSSRVLATAMSFNGNALTKQEEVRTTTSTYNGVGLWSKTVTSGESGNIVVTWSGNNSRRTVTACVLNNATGAVEATTTAFNNTGTTTANITTITNNAIIISACSNKDGYKLTSVGTDHIADTSTVAGAHAGALGHVLVPIAGAKTGIGFTASPTPTGEALVLVAFVPVNNTVAIEPQSYPNELSNNEYQGTPYNVPTYEETFLKLRRY